MSVSVGLAFAANRFGVVRRSGSGALSILSASCVCATRAIDTPRMVALLERGHSAPCGCPVDDRDDGMEGLSVTGPSGSAGMFRS